MATRDTAGAIGTYVGALAADDVDLALNTLSADAVFQSPFHTWRRHHVPSVFRARSQAFSDLVIESVIRDGDRALILWRATVDGDQVEGAELVSVSDHAIGRIDVFLRPANMLGAVHQAMVAAWPR